MTPLKDRGQSPKSKDPTRLRLTVAAFLNSLLWVSDVRGNTEDLGKMRGQDVRKAGRRALLTCAAPGISIRIFREKRCSESKDTQA